MRAHHHDIGDFRQSIFRGKNVLRLLLTQAWQLVRARQVGLVYGTDSSGGHFLPPAQWDRGVMDRFEGPGLAGLFMRYAGALIVKWRNLSPVYLYERDELGEQQPAKGIIACILRNHTAFYDQGIRIFLVDRKIAVHGPEQGTPVEQLSIVSYDGTEFLPLQDIQVDMDILKAFRADNFMAAYIPDYGAIAFNTVQRKDLIFEDGRFRFSPQLKICLDQLTAMIETASLVYLGQARGEAAARLIRRKEIRLRRTAARLKEKEKELALQEAHLLSVGAVTPIQLAMAPVVIHDGVYGFVDMVGSVRVSRQLLPREYFRVLNLCNEIGADHAQRFGCRVDNIMGDAIYFESLSVFDDASAPAPGPWGRLMRMTCLLASVLADIHQLALTHHPLDRGSRVHHLLRNNGIGIGFRAGMSLGRSLVGPLGSRKRRIVTAVGEQVDLASRLQSTGQAHHIHTTAKEAALLEDAWVSKDTPLVFAFANEVLSSHQNLQGNASFPFLEFYGTWRCLHHPVLRTPGPVSYKEFKGAETRLIPCLPDTSNSMTCAGI